MLWQPSFLESFTLASATCRDVQYNRMTGTLPTELGALTSLTLMWEAKISEQIMGMHSDRVKAGCDARYFNCNCTTVSCSILSTLFLCLCILCVSLLAYYHASFSICSCSCRRIFSSRVMLQMPTYEARNNVTSVYIHPQDICYTSIWF